MEVPLTQILLHSSVANAVKQYLPDMKFTGFKKDPTGFLSPLNRMSSVMSADMLPPITVRYKASKNGIDYYEVVDGRHRFARAIITGRESIPVIVVD